MIEIASVLALIALAAFWYWRDMAETDAPHEDDEYSGRTRRDIEDEYRKAQD